VMSRMERLSMSSTSEGVGNLKFRMNALVGLYERLLLRHDFESQRYLRYAFGDGLILMIWNDGWYVVKRRTKRQATAS